MKELLKNKYGGVIPFNKCGNFKKQEKEWKKWADKGKKIQDKLIAESLK